MRLVSFALSFLTLVFAFRPVAGQTIQPFYDRVDAFLAASVRDGLVDYAALHGNPAELNALVEAIAGMDRSGLSPADEQAFLVNAYNILVIKNVVDHYPIDSPLDANGFFDRDKFDVAGASLTLNDLEKKQLFASYPDPRFHFVLVCAAVGCPMLIDEAYRGETLEAQLEERTGASLNDPLHVRQGDAEDSVYLSEIFFWYRDDFTANGASVQAFINKYRTTPIAERAKLDKIVYDWRLNDEKKKP